MYPRNLKELVMEQMIAKVKEVVVKWCDAAFSDTLSVPTRQLPNPSRLVGWFLQHSDQHIQRYH